jgi:hypothetical protein
MKRFAVAYISFFDNKLKMATIAASSEEEAARYFIADNLEGADDMLEVLRGKTFKEMQSACIDWDANIQVVEI